MRLRRAALVALAAAAVMGLHADAARTTLDPQSVAGVYKHRFDNSDVDGEHFVSQDALEIVRRLPGQAYIHVYLNFFNGHSCEASGLAEVQGWSMIYDSYKLRDGTYCRLTFEVTPKRIVLHDPDSVCLRELCGARGVFEGAYFERAWRHPIHNTRRLLQSDAFQGAIDEYTAAHPAR